MSPQSLGGQHAIAASARVAAKQKTAEFNAQNAASTITTVRSRWDPVLAVLNIESKANTPLTWFW